MAGANLVANTGGRARKALLHKLCQGAIRVVCLLYTKRARAHIAPGVAYFLAGLPLLAGWKPAETNAKRAEAR